MKHKKKKQTIFTMFLIPLVVLMLVQSLLTMGVLVFRKTSRTLQNYSVSMMSRMVENRKVILQNDMTQRWSALSDQEMEINHQLEEFLQEKDMTIQELLDSKTAKEELIERIFPDCLNLVDSNLTTGMFFILTGEDVQAEANYQGIFLRDSNPLSSPANHSDILMERGRKELSRQYHIAMDTYWTTSFQMHGQGQNTDEEFFYNPWMAAMEFPQAESETLGFWSTPFVLGSNQKDAHEMISYSIPLRYEDTVYGILGVEISVSYLYDYLPMTELQGEEQAGYALAVRQGDGSYRILLGRGVLYNLVKNQSLGFMLEETDYENLEQVEDIRLGNQSIYAVPYSLNIYSGHAPYEDTDWVLMGFNTEEELFGMGRQLYLWMLVALLIGLLFGLVSIYLMMHRLTRPIQRLMACISRGTNGLQEYTPSNILEVDGLYEVVSNLTEKQRQAEELLTEEKELYRLVLETTHDTFFSYDFKNDTIDVINNEHLNGHWSCAEPGIGWDLSRMVYVQEEDRARMQKELQELPDTWNRQVRICTPYMEKYCWFLMTITLLRDKEGERWKIVGRFCNIQKQKEKEEEERKRIAIDGVTGFYSYPVGMERLEKARHTQPFGAFLYMTIDNLRELNEENGITFSDMVLEEMGQIVRRITDSGSICIRFNADASCVWMPGAAEEETVAFVNALMSQIRRQFDPQIFRIVLHIGIALAQENETEQELVRMAKQAQILASEAQIGEIYRIYRPGKIINRQLASVQWKGKQLEAREYGKKVNLLSLALLLFGKGNNMNAQMSLLFRKVGQYYHASAVKLVVLRPDFHSMYLEYQWQREETGEQKERASSYHKAALLVFAEQISKTGFLSWSREEALIPEAVGFCQAADAKSGVAVPLYDNGSLMGVLSILELDEKLRKSPEEQKNLMDLGGIIQSQMNQQRHDLASKAKSEFLSRMSHEIRTPMNGIIGMTAIALQKNQTPEKMTDCLHKIQTSSDYLLGLINDILDMSKIESGKMRLVPENFSMTELLGTVHELIRPQAESKSITYEPRIYLTQEWYWADKLRISQVLINLLGNAVKFTPEGGRIILTIREESQKNGKVELFFSVRDNGMGIAKENQERIFRAFEQTQTTTVSRQKGTGLGLSISNRLIKMMGSRIKLESAPGAGSDFSFHLLLPIGEAQANMEEEERVTFDGYRVLLVEDNELNAEIAQGILEEYHFSVDSVGDGAEAVERMEQTEPGTYDLILMDIMMPVMDGLEATRIIRSMEREDCRRIPIIAMSANAFDDDLKKSVECGMNGHLSKPVEVDKIYKLLKETLKP